MRIKLSLKRLQPNWPCDEIISQTLGNIRRYNVNTNTIYSSPTKTALKQVWLRGLPIRPSRIKTIETEYSSDALDCIFGINLLNYLRANNSDINLNHETILPIIHIAFNIMGLYNKTWNRSGVIFDFITTTASDQNGISRYVSAGTEYCLLSLKEQDITNLYNDLDLVDYISFWNKIFNIYDNLSFSNIYGHFATVQPNQHRPFPATRSGFRSRENEEYPPEYPPSVVPGHPDNPVNIPNNNDGSFEVRYIVEPFNWTPFDSIRAQEPIDPIIQQCIDILSQREISQITKQHIYELILACSSE